jgi:hypothetical protein
MLDYFGLLRKNTWPKSKNKIIEKTLNGDEPSEQPRNSTSSAPSFQHNQSDKLIVATQIFRTVRYAMHARFFLSFFIQPVIVKTNKRKYNFIILLSSGPCSAIASVGLSTLGGLPLLGELHRI